VFKSHLESPGNDTISGQQKELILSETLHVRHKVTMKHYNKIVAQLSKLPEAPPGNEVVMVFSGENKCYL